MPCKCTLERKKGLPTIEIVQKKGKYEKFHERTIQKWAGGFDDSDLWRRIGRITDRAN